MADYHWLVSSRKDLPLEPVLKALKAISNGPGTILFPNKVYKTARKFRKKVGEADVIRVLSHIEGAPFQLLKTRWKFIDKETARNLSLLDVKNSFDLTPEDVSNVYLAEQFLHPLTKIPVLDYMHKICLFYEVLEGLQELLDTEKRGVS